MLEVLGRNSRRSFAPSDSIDMKAKDKAKKISYATTIRKIVTGNENNLISRSFAASAPSFATAANPIPNRNVNRAKVLTDFIFRNGLR